MNNDLEQFSEERLMELIHESSKPEIAALARIALAAKQAKPVGYIAEVSGNRVGVLRGLPMPEIGSFIYTTQQTAHTERDGWIKCSERMPKDSQWCAVNTEYGYYVQCWGSEQGWLGDEISIPNCDVTHWMPLPAAPKPESE